MDTCVLLPEEFSLVLTLHPSPDNVMEMKVDLWSNTTLSAGTSFYPDQGRLKLDKLEVYSFLEETDVRNQYGCEDSVSRIDNRDVRHCNWVRFLNHSTNISEVNLVGVKVKGETVFQTVRTILPNEEIVAYLQTRDEVEQEMDTMENHAVDLLTPDLSIVKKEFDVTPLSPASNPVTRDLLTSQTTRDDDCKSRVSDMTHSGDEIEKQTQGYSPHSPSTPETERYSDSGTSPLSSGEDLPLNLTSPKTPCSTLSGLTSQVGVYHTPLDKTSPSTSSTSPLSAQSPLTPPLMSRFDISPSFPRQLPVDKPKRNRERTWLPCDVCGKKFDRPSLLKRHMRTHTGEKPHACDVCDKAFSTSSSLNTHRRIHSGEKPHQCQVCGKRFTASSNLYYHRMTHNKDKPHKCTMCDKSFPTPGDLRSHMYVHSGTWPFRCDVCNRGFSKQTNLKNHLLLHSGDKPHECPVCQKKFAIPCNLRTHMKTHEEDDQGSCVTCGRTYLKKETSTSGQCSDCIRASSPGSPSPTQRHVSDFSISKLTNTDEKREETRSMKSPTYDQRLLLQSMYNPMQFMSPTAAPFITRQHSPIGCLPMYGAHSYPSTDSNQRLVRGINNVLPLPATVYQSRAQISATAQGWPGLMAK